MIIDLSSGPQLKSTTQCLMCLMHTHCGGLDSLSIMKPIQSKLTYIRFISGSWNL